ncbi:MAG: trigger factor [Saprospiraceae bacterium]|nr:trigger factor [Saprospiraceae bacterium]
MSTIVREDIDHLNAVLTLTLDKSDYEGRWLDELKSYKSKAQMKGFRKGKTPLSVIKKMYGKALLAEVVNDLVQTKLSEYLKEKDLNILGYPISSLDQELFDFDLKSLGEYVFKFDLGMAPEFEVQGASEEDSYSKYDVVVSEASIDDELENARRQLGKQEEVEENILDNDIIELEVKELDSDNLKEGGISNTFSVLVNAISDESVKQTLLKSKKGDSLKVNLFELEEKANEEYVRNYYLGLDKEDTSDFNAEFEATIQTVKRLVPAELDQELFDKFLGEGEVSSEEEAREKIKENIKGHYEKQSDALLFREQQEALMDKNPMELPETFLKRWIKVSNENKVSDEQVEKEFPEFKKSLQWSLIRGKLLRQFDIKIEQEDIRKKIAEEVRGYLAGQSFVNEDFINNMVDRMMGEEEQVNRAAENAITEKLAEVLSEKVTITKQEVTVDELNEIIRKITNPEPEPEVTLQTGLENLGDSGIEDAEIVEESKDTEE